MSPVRRPARPRPRPRPRSPRPAPPRGAALLVAMVLLTVVTTLAAGMVWQQWRAVQVETAERARAQSGLLLSGGIDIARDLLRRNARQRNGGHEDLQKLVSLPLQELRLSSLLTADRDNSADADLDAFISGSLSDAQARYNLRNLVINNKVVPEQLAILERLCNHAGLSTATAAQVADQFLLALQASNPAAPLMPQRVDDLAWLGLDADSLKRLAPFVVVLPVATAVNANTAGREVLAAVIPGMDLGSADRLIRQRDSKPFADVAMLTTTLGLREPLPVQRLDVRSSFMFVQGRLRIGDRALEEMALLERRGTQVTAIQRQRVALQTGTAAAAPAVR